MDSIYQLFILLCFVAVVLALEGGYLAWNNSKGEEAQRMVRRLRAISAGEHGVETASLLKRQSAGDLSGLERLLLQLPHVHRLDRMLLQAAYSRSLSHFLMVSLMAATSGFLFSMLLIWPLWVMLLVSAGCGLFPLIRLLSLRRQRLLAFEQQLPDTLDLMARALRAGHAFSGAIEMVGTEASDPIAGEFRTTFDEINYGISLHDALLNLATRVPSTDLKYFVIAVLLQRETGGNLAELLGNLSALIRARFKLLGTIRVLSAEGRMSAWVLSLLPFVAAALLNIINPKLMSVLWTDPVGVQLVKGALAMAMLGIFWMWRIVKIRV
jgi:tight adherence protein B